MEVRTDGKHGTLVPSGKIAIDQFREDTQLRQEQWAKRLCDDPDSFADMEQEIDLHYRLGAGCLVASLLAEVTQEPDLEAYVEGIRDPLIDPLDRLLAVQDRVTVGIGIERIGPDQ